MRELAVGAQHTYRHRGESTTQGLGRGLLELVSHRSLCLWRHRFSGGMGNLKSLIPSFPLTGWCRAWVTLNLQRSQAKTPSLSKPLPQTLSPLRK